MNPSMEKGGTLWLHKGFTEMTATIQKSFIPEALQIGSPLLEYSCELV